MNTLMYEAVCISDKNKLVMGSLRERQVEALKQMLSLNTSGNFKNNRKNSQ